MTSTSPQRPSWRTPLDLLFWLGRHELATLLMFAAVAGGVWAFLELASEVGEHDTHAVDERLLLLLRNPADASDPLGPPWFEEVMRDFTALGGIGVQVVIVAATCVFLAIQRKHHAVVLLVASVGGALALSLLLKHGYDRPRPDLVPHGSIVMTSSFPSGHSMLSAATYLTLGALVARVLAGRRMKAFVILFAALLAGLAGVSRVYLGVHWPTDVVAGWTLGATWAALCWLVARFLQRRGTVEDDDGVAGA